jgi:hypothetical protein
VRTCNFLVSSHSLLLLWLSVIFQYYSLLLLMMLTLLKVICARGKAAKDHPGNQWFRSLVAVHIQEYAVCESKLEKSFVVSKVLKQVRKASPKGGFVKSVKGKYWEVGDRLSREKIGQVRHGNGHTPTNKQEQQPKMCVANMSYIYLEKICSLLDVSL